MFLYHRLQASISLLLSRRGTLNWIMWQMFDGHLKVYDAMKCNVILDEKELVQGKNASKKTIWSATEGQLRNAN